MTLMRDAPVGHEIVLVRHGETEWSSSGQHTSFSDIPLTARGKDQARTLANRLAHYQFSLVLMSPRIRAIQTCELASSSEGAEVTDDLAEWNYGDYEGRTTASIREERPGWTIFNGGAPGGETADEVGARADRLLARASAVDGTVAVFSHAHFLRVLAVRWIGLPVVDGALLALDTATISVLSYEREQRVIRVWNS
jgi:probable phosphoglycerate mutase